MTQSWFFAWSSHFCGRYVVCVSQPVNGHGTALLSWAVYKDRPVDHDRFLSVTIRVPGIVQCRGSRGGRPGQGVPQWSPGQSPGRGSGDEVPDKPMQNAKLAYSFWRFPVQNLGFNEYRSRAWTVCFANTRFKQILMIQWGGDWTP